MRIMYEHLRRLTRNVRLVNPIRVGQHKDVLVLRHSPALYTAAIYQRQLREVTAVDPNVTCLEPVAVQGPSMLRCAAPLAVTRLFT